MDITEAITHVSLCSGYDGIGLGLRRIWGKVREIAHVEIEAFAAANLVSKMEAGEMDACPVWTDLKTFPSWAFRGCVDILSAGFPCQPFSAAGKGGADADPRHLWPHVRQSIGLIRPGMVVLENVEGIISSKLKGNDWHDPEGTPVLLHVLRELERTGYRCTWGVFSASEVGAPHQRKRVFIIGVDDTGLLRPEIFQKYTTGIKQSSSSLADTDSIHRSTPSEGWKYDTKAGYASEELGNTKHDGSHATPMPRGTTETVRRAQKRENCSSEFEGANRPEELAHATSLRGGEDYRTREAGFSHEANEVQQRWPARPGEPQYEWEEPRTLEPKLGGATNGTSSRVDRLRLLGNGVVPQTAERAVRVLLEELMEDES